MYFLNPTVRVDAKAKLPADETVKAGIPELVHATEAAPKPPPPEAARMEKADARGSAESMLNRRRRWKPSRDAA